MLITLMYHRSFPGRYGNSIETLENHFRELKKHYPIILPKEKLVAGRCNICISFDDATYDFYYQVYPLLKKYNLKALLAVPVGYIQEKHKIAPYERLKALENFSFQKSPPSHAFCSFEELEEMLISQHIQVASHGLHHVDLTSVSVETELKESQAILQTRLRQAIDTFVFPYGKCNQHVITKAKAYYTTLMRIGCGMNFSWNNPLQYRVSADEVSDIKSVLSPFKKLMYWMKTVSKYLD